MPNMFFAVRMTIRKKRSRAPIIHGKEEGKVGLLGAGGFQVKSGFYGRGEVL